ncbi:MAG: SDR family oxidoreductase [Paludibacter sp.]|jgi:short-subunit dehydrogenase|nr:SDR family oxidoreductase [Paludibacter sp.]
MNKAAKTALITGATSGIGYELAKIHAATSGNLVLVARSEEKLKQISAEFQEKYGIACHIIVKDLQQTNAAQEVFAEVNSAKISVDYLINNAGFGINSPFAETDYEKITGMLDLDVRALTQLTHLFVNQMLERGNGKILNVASIAAFTPGAFMAVYCAAKAYVLSFSEAIRYETLNSGVTVTAVSPGPTQSNFMAVSSFDQSPMLKGKTLPSPVNVAQTAYKAMLKGKRNVIPGWGNKITVFALKLVPHDLGIKLAGDLMRK